MYGIFTYTVYYIDFILIYVYVRVDACECYTPTWLSKRLILTDTPFSENNNNFDEINTYQLIIIAFIFMFLLYVSIFFF